MNTSHNKYLYSEITAWERFVDFVGLAWRNRGEVTTTAESAGEEDQTRKFYLRVPFQDRYFFKIP